MRSPAKRVQGSSSAGRRWSSSGKLEELEWRLLMTASTGTYPAYILDPSQAVTPLEQAQAAAIRDVQGPTLAGNAGPLAKIGSDLAEVYEEHRLFTGSTGSGSGSDTTSGGSGTGTGGSTSSVAFKPSNSELQVQGNDVVINAIPVGSMPALESTLVGMGMQITGVAGDEVSGLFPLQNLPSLAALSSLNFARAAYAPVVNAGLLDSQGDQALKAQTARSQFNVDGTGIKVGIISDSFNTSGNGSMNTDIATGDLPAAGVQILADGNGEDEGRGMAQIVHDIAPGAAIAFSAGGDSQASMAQSVNNLQSVAHSQVIVDDLGFLDEPFFQDSVISQAVDNVVAKGVTYFSAAGNEGDNSYQSAWVSSGTAGPAGGQLLNFATSGSAVSQQPVTIASGATVNFSFQFSQPFASVGGKAATSQVNIYLLDNTGTIVASGNSTTVGGDALQLLNYQNGNQQRVVFNRDRIGIRASAVVGEVHRLRRGRVVLDRQFQQHHDQLQLRPRELRRRDRRGSGAVLPDAVLRPALPAVGIVFLARRDSHLVRLGRQPVGHSHRPARSGDLRHRWREHYVLWIDRGDVAGQFWSVQLFRHVCRRAACRRRGRADVAGRRRTGFADSDASSHHHGEYGAAHFRPSGWLQPGKPGHFPSPVRLA